MTEENKQSSPDQEIKDFLYIVTHDLKNPVRGIKQAADWLLQDYNDKLDENGTKLVELLQEKASLLSQMIDELHTYSNVNFKPNFIENIRLQAVLEGALDSVQKNILKKDIKTKVIIKEEFLFDETVTIDSVKFSQVLVEILNIIVRLHNNPLNYVNCVVKSTKDKEKNTQMISIECETVLLDEEKLVNIFRPFQEIMVDKNRVQTFMRLALVKKIIESFQGTITVNAEGKRGLKFLINIPFRI